METRIKTDVAEQRELTGLPGTILKLIAMGMSCYQLYIGYFPAPISLRHRAIHLLFAFTLLFFIYPFKPNGRKIKPKVELHDWLFIGLVIFSLGYTILFAWRMLNERIPFISPLEGGEWIAGILVVFLTLEATRRTLGSVLVIVALLFLAYGLWGNYLPPPFWHKGYPLETILDQLYLSHDGIWGVPIHVTSTYVFLFMMFGTYLTLTGAGDFFTDLAHSLTSKSVGGPAKTAVIASSLMGTLSGSSVGNVVTTGAFTIPMMKKAGYRPHFAAAVEAVASTGGQIVPPVMGAAAFIMVEYTGIPYLEIMKHAIIPAFLYYLGVYLMVHMESMRLNLRMPPDTIAPRTIDVILSRGYLVLPVFLIILLLMYGYTPLRASFGAFWILIGLVLVFSKDRKATLKLFPVGLERSAKLILPVTTACACAGIIVGVILLTGLGQRMTAIILELSQGILPIALVLTMVLAMVLGMGMPTSSAYIIMAVLLAPGLVNMGVSLISAHFFVFYFACLSAITPPVALASYAGAGLAGASPMSTGYTGFRLGIAAYIVPFMFVYGPSLLFVGSPLTILTTLLTASFGVLALAGGVQGWWHTEIRLHERILLMIAAILLIYPDLYTDAAGLGILGITYFFQRKRSRTIIPGRGRSPKDQPG
ncbi:MAG: TRAP transporter permease [Pseudomonadota bacterium]